MINISTIGGKLFSDMIISGANNLYNHKSEVDELNVFPVPDGDTGTNMSLTVKAVASELLEFDEESLTKVADKVSFATLRGARGNSGVILSQLFRGISKSLKGKDECTANEFAEALVAGAKAAYKAVMSPTEGTILTVARVSAEGALESVTEDSRIIDIMTACIKAGKEALDNTPEQLPALKEAGVVDAGGCGWLYVLEGMTEVLKTGEIIKSTAKEPVVSKPKAQASVKTEDIKFKYCTEFLIEKSDRESSSDDFRDTVSKIGDSMLVIDDEDIVKVHIHTNNPGIVLEEAGKLGELINIKIDNMKNQHRTLIKEAAVKTEKKSDIKIEEKAPLKEYGFVAVCTGKGIIEDLKDLGVDYTIEGGQTMNPSTADILKAVGRVPASTVFVFPNNKNIILAANQAKELSGKNVIVIPTRSIPQCVGAMVAFSENKSAEINERSMNNAAKAVKTGQITFAVRDTSVENQKISKGDILGLKEGKITNVGSNAEEVLFDLVDEMYDDDSEFITVYYGKGIKKQTVSDILENLEEKYPDCEISVRKGGQPLYYYIISVE